MSYNYKNLHHFPQANNTLNDLVLIRNPAIYNQACEILQAAFDNGILIEPNVLCDFKNNSIHYFSLDWQSKYKPLMGIINPDLKFNITSNGELFIHYFGANGSVNFTCIHRAFEWLNAWSNT